MQVGAEPAPVCIGSGGVAVLEFEAAIVGGRTEVEGGDVRSYTAPDGGSVALVASAGLAVGEAHHRPLR